MEKNFSIKNYSTSNIPIYIPLSLALCVRLHFSCSPCPYMDMVFPYKFEAKLKVHIWSWRTKNKMARQNSQKESMTSFWRIKNKMYGRWFTLATLWHKIEDYQHFIMKMKDFQFFISDEVQITPNIFSLKRSQKHVL